jgi:predicted nucleic acid-binding protein
LLAEGFQQRIFSFDTSAAEIYGQQMALAEKEGFHPASFDVQIAAIALSQKAALATRNVRDFKRFEMAGLSLLNPWEQ